MKNQDLRCLISGTQRICWTETCGELAGETDDDPFMKNHSPDDFVVLTESDIPGAASNGKQPQETLNN